MANVLILGANGQLARNTMSVFLRDTDAVLTFLIVKLSLTPGMESRRSPGVSRGQACQAERV